VLIPRIFHQIWVGPDRLPDEYARYQETWLALHPGWELRYWTDENLPERLQRPEAYERLRSPVERADILRLEVVFRFGGVHVDVDFECLRPLEPLIGDAEFFIGRAKPGRVNGALFGAVAGHPLLAQALEEIRPREAYGYDKEATGPRFLDAIVTSHEDEVHFLDSEILYPRTPEERSSAYALHHEARTWKDAELLRIDMQRAEQKMEQALEKAASWRARCKEAETELDRLKRSWPYRVSRLGSSLTRKRA
jgi:inositol phosphorylceramide mannosyltransferase catalytic subunit